MLLVAAAQHLGNISDCEKKHYSFQEILISFYYMDIKNFIRRFDRRLLNRKVFNKICLSKLVFSLTSFHQTLSSVEE